MQKATLASVVIPTCNRPELLRRCLDALASEVSNRPGSDIQVVITDDSADDRSESLVTRDYPWARWVRGPRRGPAANRNAGVAASQGQWIIFTDDDCIPQPGWLDAYFRAIKAAPLFSVFEGCTVADRQRRRLDEESPSNTLGGYLWSCNMAITRRAFNGVGGFCETFPFAAMEDVDLRLRLRAGGQLFPFVADAIVCHPYRATKGIRFAVDRGKSYLHLVERHPYLLGSDPWRSWLLTLCRRISWLLRDGASCRFRGLPFAVKTLVVTSYYEALARWRLAARPLQTLHPYDGPDQRG